MKRSFRSICWLFTIPFWTTYCNTKSNTPSAAAINEIDLKKGEVVLCGPPGQQLGTVSFDITATEENQKKFDVGLTLLHSFEYDEAEKVFAKIIETEPQCAMAYWGVAMSNYHPLWTPPTEYELGKGEKSIAIAQSLSGKSAKETAFIDALAIFYKDWKNTAHKARCINMERAMEDIYTGYPGDKEAAVFYALALNAAAEPSDKTFAKQKKAGSILTGLYPADSVHPGIIHYIIHSYDSPELAALALPAANKYASIAPSSAHALHMPSHIFTRMGKWDESINSNLASTEAAKCYAENMGINGHWDEELHGLDYLVYAYLQKGENTIAKTQLDYLNEMKVISPVNFKVAYALAAIPSRYFLENKDWKGAAGMKLPSLQISWEQYPWQKSIIFFTRAMGLVHTKKVTEARAQLDSLANMHASLTRQKDAYKAGQVDIQIKTVSAWILLAEGKRDQAIQLMELAVNLEDNTQKHPVTPCEVIPARELLGDMLMQAGEPAKALLAYEKNLKDHPNRFNGLYGAAVAANATNNKQLARSYYQQLKTVANATTPQRPELKTTELFLKKSAG